MNDFHSASMILNNNPDEAMQKNDGIKPNKNSFNYSRKEMMKFADENKEKSAIPMIRRKSEAAVALREESIADPNKKKNAFVIHKKIKYYDANGKKKYNFYLLEDQ